MLNHCAMLLSPILFGQFAWLIVPVLQDLRDMQYKSHQFITTIISKSSQNWNPFMGEVVARSLRSPEVSSINSDNKNNNCNHYALRF